jgi:hypothetical protein
LELFRFGRCTRNLVLPLPGKGGANEVLFSLHQTIADRTFDQDMWLPGS